MDKPDWTRFTGPTHIEVYSFFLNIKYVNWSQYDGHAVCSSPRFDWLFSKEQLAAWTFIFVDYISVKTSHIDKTWPFFSPI